MNSLRALFQSKTTVWSVDDLRMLWRTENERQLRNKIHYYTKTGQMLRLRRGLYALNTQYSRLEVAQKLIRPSYISLDTALRKHGVIHQYAELITCVASYPRLITIDNQQYQYHQMDRQLLSCPLGIEQNAQYALALPERALCDALYFGFQPDTQQYDEWNGNLLRKIAKEFDVPRVTNGLIQYALLS